MHVGLLFPLTFHLQTEIPFYYNEGSWFLFIILIYFSTFNHYQSHKIIYITKRLKNVFLYSLIVVQLSLSLWLIDKAFLASDISKAFRSINTRYNKTKLTNLLSRHLEDSYYEPLANYILLLHQRRSWITRTNDQDQLKEFIEKVNENHSWLPSKNLPVLKIIALAKLKKFDEAKKEYRKSLYRFPSNKKNLEDARRAMIFYKFY